MDEIWMLDYLNAVFPRWGVFDSEEQAWAWVDRHDPERRSHYKAFSMTVNRELRRNALTTSPRDRYASPR